MSRDYGTGQLIAKTPGRWQLRWYEGKDPLTGLYVRRSKTMTSTKTDAQRELSRLAQGHKRTTTRLTLGDLLELALPALPIRPLTQENYRTALAHLPNPTRQLVAADITPPVAGRIMKGVAELTGPQTVHKLHTALMSCWRHAITSGWVIENPWKGHRLPPVTKTAGRSPSPAEIRALIANAQPGLEALWLRLSLIIGTRPGELLALRWSMIDLSSGAVQVWATKTERGRVVHLDPASLTAWRLWMIAQRERALAAGVPLDPDPYLISNVVDSAKPWTVNYAGSYRWPKLAERAEVSELRLYDLRHASMSAMMHNGIDAVTAARRIGDDPTTALAVYSHADVTTDKHAATVLANWLDNTG